MATGKFIDDATVGSIGFTSLSTADDFAIVHDDSDTANPTKRLAWGDLAKRTLSSADVTWMSAFANLAAVDSANDKFIVWDNDANAFKTLTATQILDRLLTTLDISALSAITTVEGVDPAADQFLVWDATATAQFKTLPASQLVNKLWQGPKVAITSTPQTLTSATSGSLYHNTGATVAITVNLPAATAGLRYSFVRSAAYNITLDGNGSETINGALTHTITSAGRVDVECFVSGAWVVTSFAGAGASSLFNVKTYGAVGDGVADDTAEIQAALDAAASVGGEVYVPATSSFYLISAALVVPAGVTLRLDDSAVIKATTNINMVDLSAQARLVGGKIWNSNGSFSKALVYITGTNIAGNKKVPVGVFRTSLVGPLIGNGIGIHLSCDSSSATQAIQFWEFSQISFSELNDGVKIEVNEPSGIAFVNANNFSNLSFWLCTYAVRSVMSGAGNPACDGNVFTNCQVQADTGVTKGIVLGTGSLRNQFIGWSFFDWGVTGQSYAVDFSANTNSGFGAGNRFSGVGCAATECVGGTYHMDTFENTYVPLRLPEVRISQRPATEADWTGTIHHNSEGTRHKLLTSRGGTQWLGVGSFNVVTLATDSTISASDFGPGIAYNNYGAAGTVTYTLDASNQCEIGDELVFSQLTNQAIRIDPHASDVFYDPKQNKYSTAGKYLQYSCAAAGTAGFVVLRCYATGVWSMDAVRGVVTTDYTLEGGGSWT
jgi:hypothetical protein